MMGTDIFNIDASWTEKLMKRRVSFLTAPTVTATLQLPYNSYLTACVSSRRSAAHKNGFEVLLVSRQNNTMIGYLFSKKELNEGIFNQSTSSMDSLLQRTGVDVEELLFGDSSLGSMFEKAGYKAVPSPR